jgi:hypothetical protein
MSARTLGQMAIGPRDGDYLKLENQWARITIEVDSDCCSHTGTSYVVTGDLIATRKRFEAFPTMGAAITYAMKCLALHEAGRMS